jgi:osmotically-inducible protein OsmY
MGTQDFSGRLAAISISSRPMLSQQIVDCAEDCLRRNPYLALENVQCDFHEGVLTLRGCLPTYYLSQMAQATVGPITGIQRIVNEIEVKRGAR